MDIIERYFTLAATDDVDAFVAQFAPGAVVVDDGHPVPDLRAWRRDVPDVTYTVTDVDGTSADVTVAGDFPGSPVDLRFAFGADGDRITRLDIAPR
ncbi:nuclear transport factor 2 family protein [Actinomycetospora sp. C-140]